MPSLRQFLQNLCCDSLWNYAVFWKLQHENLMLLTWEDGFFDFPIYEPTGSMINSYSQKYLNDILISACISNSENGDIGESPIGLAVTEMSNTYHILGKGVVGEVASTGSPLWIFPDIVAPGGISCSKCPEEWALQFLAGIKTILLIPCVPHGVLQLGSLEMVPENAQLVAYLRDRFDAHQKIAQISPLRSNNESPVQLSAVMSNVKDSLVGINNDNNDLRAADISVVDDLSNAGEMTSLYMIQDMYTGVPGILEYADESKPGMHPVGLIGVAEQLDYQSCEDYRWKITESGVCRSSCFEKEVYAASYSDYFDGDFVHDFVAQSNQYIQAFSDSGQTAAAGSINEDLIYNVDPSSWESNECCFKADDVENLLEAIVTTACRNSESSNVSYSMESFHTSSGISFSASQRRNQIMQQALVGGKIEPWSSPTSASVVSDVKTLTNPSLECSMGAVVEQQHQPKKRSRSIVESECSFTKTKRAKLCDRQQSRRPRDRQLIQDRLKELRELVPNSAKCSIDGLLDRTIKHMLFMKNITNQADKLRHQVKKEVITGKSLKSRKVKAKSNYQPGTSWALELGSDEQTCPIIVKDLDFPGYMLIEMLCNDHDGFLDIADVIHRLKLTLLKGVMENRIDGTWARFIVEASGSFHRLDIFWPLMKLLQRSSSPMSTKI